MNTTTIAILLASALSLAGCGANSVDSDPMNDPHTVKEYYENDELTARTIEACRASNDAERRANGEKEACANAWKANNAKTWNEPLPPEN